MPSLYKIDARGNQIEWRIWVEGNVVYHTFGVVGGKMRDPVARTVEATRNRSADEQAQFFADSKWRKQLEKEYAPGEQDCEGQALYKQVKKEKHAQGGTNHKASESARTTNHSATRTVDVVVRSSSIMKAHKFTEQSKKIKWDERPYAQIKYDGTRCLANVELQPDKSRRAVMTTSSGKQFVFLTHIKEALERVLVGEFANVILDGECYTHSLVDQSGETVEVEARFNMITGACRSVRGEAHLLENQMQLHVFDVKDSSLDQEQRFELLDRLFETVDYSLPLIKAPRYELDSEDDVHTLHDRFANEEYEGVMIRNRHGKYVPRRSYDVQKYKEFHDEECEIIGAKQGHGTEVGTVVWVCRYSNGETFDVRPRGSVEVKRHLYNERDAHIGSQLTVRYQSLTKPHDQGGVPRFPVGISIRDYE